MSVHVDEGKHISLSLDQIERLCPVAKALSSPMRARMIALLDARSMNVNELAEALSLPVSTAALNVRQLEAAAKNAPEKKEKQRREPLPVEYTELQDRLRAATGLRVTLEGSARKGRIVLQYESEEELQRLWDWMDRA